jgi:hypothetical protein
MIGTAKLGEAQTKPDVVSSRQIAARASKLDAWEASLRKALAAKPPVLTPLSRYASVSVYSSPGYAAMPTVATPGRRTVTQTRAPAKEAPPVRSPVKNQIVSSSPKAHDPDKTRPEAPAVDPEPERTGPASAPAAAPTLVASVAPPAPPKESTTTANAPPAAPPTSQSVEKQCEALEQAAEGKGEQAKKSAETQCEALKQAAERAKEKGG